MMNLFDIDDMAYEASANIQSFMEGIFRGLQEVSIELTQDEFESWKKDYGALYLFEQFLRGYYDQFHESLDGWEKTAGSAWDIVSSPIDSASKGWDAVEKSASMLTNPKYRSELKRAGRIMGAAAAGWLNESKSSPPDFTWKCGELGAMVIWEIIETLTTMGASKALKIGRIAKKVAGKLPSHFKKRLPTKNKSGSSKQLTDKKGRSDKGIRDRGTGDKELEADHATKDYSSPAETAAPPSVSKRGTGKSNTGTDTSEDRKNGRNWDLDSEEVKGNNLDEQDWTHDTRKNKQDKRSDLPDEEGVESKSPGNTRDRVESFPAKSRNFGKALRLFNKRFKKHSRKAVENLSETNLKRAAKLDNLQSEMLSLALETRRKNRNKEDKVNPYIITDENILKKSRKNYEIATSDKMFRAYGDLRKNIWELIFTDKDFQAELIQHAISSSEKLTKKYSGGLSKKQINLSIWPDRKKRNDILYEAYLMVWEKGESGIIAPRTSIIDTSGNKATIYLTLEHLTRRTDNPYKTIDPDNLDITTYKINVTINEAIRRVEQENRSSMAVPMGPSDDDVIEVFIRANRHLL